MSRYLPPFNTCRVCGEGSSSLIKYGVRHYTHAECAMKKWGGDFFSRITPWRASQFPYLIAAKHGHEKALIARAEQAK